MNAYNNMDFEPGNAILRASPDDLDEEMILIQARDRYEIASKYWEELYQTAMASVDFYNGEQWDAETLEERSNPDNPRPCLVISMLSNIVNSVLGKTLDHVPGVELKAAVGGTERKVKTGLDGEMGQAAFKESMLRYIIDNCDGEAQIKQAAEHQLTAGFAIVRVESDYRSAKSFDQDLSFRTLDESFTVFFDPAAKSPYFADANYVIIKMKMEREDFYRRFPKKGEPGSLFGSESDSAGDNTQMVDEVEITEYFDRVPVKSWIMEYETPAVQGRELRMEEFTSEAEMAERRTALADTGHYIFGARESESFRVTRYLMTATEILDETEWSGTRIPLVFIPGRKSRKSSGKRFFRSMITDAMDAQMMLNYHLTAATERISTATKQRFMGTAKQFASNPDQWDSANSYGGSKLTYEPDYDTETGQLLPMPTVVDAAVLATGELQMVQQFMELVRHTTGIYAAKVGERSNEVSGVAIEARDRKGDIATFEYMDFLRGGYRHIVEIILQAMPDAYSENRLFHIMNVDLEVEDIKAEMIYGTEGDKAEESGRERHNRHIGILRAFLDPSGVSIRVTTGEAYATLSEQMEALLTEWAKHDNPAAITLMLELLDQNNIGDAKKIKRRLIPFAPYASLSKTEKEDLAKAREGEKPTPEEQAKLTEAQAKVEQAKAEQMRAEADLAKAHLEMRMLDGGADGGLPPDLAAKVQKVVKVAMQEILGAERIQQTGGAT